MTAGNRVRILGQIQLPPLISSLAAGRARLYGWPGVPLPACPAAPPRASAPRRRPTHPPSAGPSLCRALALPGRRTASRVRARRGVGWGGSLARWPCALRGGSLAPQPDPRGLVGSCQARPSRIRASARVRPDPKGSFSGSARSGGRVHARHGLVLGPCPLVGRLPASQDSAGTARSLWIAPRANHTGLMDTASPAAIDSASRY